MHHPAPRFPAPGSNPVWILYEMVSSTIFLAAFGGLVTHSLAQSLSDSVNAEVTVSSAATSLILSASPASSGSATSSASSPVTQISDGQIQSPAYSTPSPNGTLSATPGVVPSNATTTVDAAAASISPNGGILSIAPNSTTPDASKLATQNECKALIDYQLPSKNSIPSNFNFSGNVRTYYVAAEEVAWDYAPSGWDNWLGVPVQNSPHAIAAGYLNITGSLGTSNWGLGGWQKAVYKGYTDDSFTTQSEQPATNGINGPILRGEVGDMIQIMFVNNLKDHYSSMHSMGLYYGKQYEGSLYPNTTSGETPNVQEQDAVPPGGCAVYKWLISDSQAPAPGQSSRLWSYHSFVNMPADTSAGLSGPIIVYNSGEMNSTMSAHREFVVTTNTHYEARSFMAGENAKNAGVDTSTMRATNQLVRPFIGNESFWVPQLANFPAIQLSDAQGPNFYTMNGYVFGNGAPYEMCRDDPVIWYVMAFGGASHVFHLHGNNFQYNDIWQASQSINAGEMFTFNMNAQLPGVWQLLCHVSSHNLFGMQQNYVVHGTEVDGQTCPLPPLTAKLAGSP
ncbi:Cupredoxin [Aureobasidium pullulans]|uniref:Cupredoxin n=1 Tax=Aureobasidium pullulans TaxID=5580 RepID=A0A4S8XL32_AURPU|nr:Cupredoxin [Aureobasidium pullulans]